MKSLLLMTRYEEGILIQDLDDIGHLMRILSKAICVEVPYNSIEVTPLEGQKIELEVNAFALVLPAAVIETETPPLPIAPLVEKDDDIPF